MIEALQLNRVQHERSATTVGEALDAWLAEHNEWALQPSLSVPSPTGVLVPLVVAAPRNDVAYIVAWSCDAHSAVAIDTTLKRPIYAVVSVDQPFGDRELDAYVEELSWALEEAGLDAQFAAAPRRTTPLVNLLTRR